MTSHMVQGVKKLLSQSGLNNGAPVMTRNHFTILCMDGLVQFWVVILTGPIAVFSGKNG